MTYYTINEVAEMLKVHPQSLRNLANKGKLKTVKFFGSTRITSEELERVLKEKEDK